CMTRSSTRVGAGSTPGSGELLATPWSTRPGRRIGPGVRLLLCALLLALVIDVQNAHGQPTVVGTIPFPNGEPLGLGVHEGLNKLFVTEDNAGALYVIDGTTLQTHTTIPVGGSAFQV